MEEKGIEHEGCRYFGVILPPGKVWLCNQCGRMGEVEEVCKTCNGTLVVENYNTEFKKDPRIIVEWIPCPECGGMVQYGELPFQDIIYVREQSGKVVHTFKNPNETENDNEN